MKNFFLVLFYTIISFGIIVIFGLYNVSYKKNALEIVYSILIFISLFLICIKKKSILSTLTLLTFFFIANYQFGNFIIDVINPPTIPALDCSGALPMNGNWIRGAIFTLITSPIYMLIYFKKIYKFNYFEKTLAFLSLLILIILFIFPYPFVEINQFVFKKSRPIIIYPENCK